MDKKKWISLLMAILMIIVTTANPVTSFDATAEEVQNLNENFYQEEENQEADIIETDQIQLHSEPKAILEGFPFSMTADVKVSGADTYQWQVRIGEGDWTDIEGAEGTEYGFVANEASYEESYRLVVTDIQGKRYASSVFKPEKAVCYIMPLARDASVSTYSQLKDAVDDGGVIYLTSDIEITGTISIGSLIGTQNITIQSDMSKPGAPFKLIRQTTENMFSVGGSSRSGTLTFENVILDGNNLNSPDNCMVYANVNSTVTLNEGAVLQNAVGGRAVYIQGSTLPTNDCGKLVMNEGAVIQNCSGAVNGGAVYVSNKTGTGHPGSLVVNGGSFIGNSATDSGGAIYAETNGQLSINNCTFENNQAAYLGGAVFLTGASDETSFTQCEFKGNQTTASDPYRVFNGGGAVAIVSERKAEFGNCTFTQNSSHSGGGAVYIRGEDDSEDRGDTSAVMNGCTISNNEAASGGGISATMMSTVILTNVSILNNTAKDGGGIYSGGTGGDFGQATIHSGTIAGNVATSGNGAGVYTGANNNVLDQGYWNVLRLGTGRISI